MHIRRIAPLLTLIAMLVALPALAAQNGAGCPDGSVPWVYASGSTGVPWMNDTPSNGQATATHWAEGECSEAWAMVGVNPTYGMSINVYYGSPSQWNYTCIACVHSIAQNLNHVFQDVALDTGTAGGIGGQVGGGIAIGVELKEKPSGDGHEYVVDVLRDTQIIQILVDAKTGDAQRVGTEPLLPR